WVQLRLVGTESNHHAIGARVMVHAGGEIFLREVNAGNGYSSQSTTLLHFGLGRHSKVESVEIHWPNGRIERLEAKKLEDGRAEPPVPIDARSRIVEGRGVEVGG
ncbi:MAG: ASPIC/UnbV domain-containing protein, partial [Holophagales bacterium]|nr:ASPIC/UnbV domain-containing protein [Holophagales bacterium]